MCVASPISPPICERGQKAAADPGTGSSAPTTELPLGLTFHGQLHCHLAGTAAIAGFTGILSVVLLTDRVNYKAKSPPYSIIQQEAAPMGDGLPISVPCHLRLWVAPDLQEKETVRASVLHRLTMCPRVQSSRFLCIILYAGLEEQYKKKKEKEREKEKIK